MKQLLNARVNTKLLKDSLIKNRNFFIIITVLMFLTYPVPLLLDLYYFGSSNLNLVSNDSMLFLFLITAGILMITPFLYFNYLTKKRSVDFIHSLPISRSTLFLTYSIASLVLVLIPFTLTFWVGNTISYIFYDNTFEWFHLILFIRSVLLFGAIQVPTIFVIMNTGTLSDSVIFTMILFIAPFVAYFAIDDFSSSYLLGSSALSTTNILFYISPITLFLASLIKNSGLDNINLLTLYWIIGSGVLYIISCSTYRKWKSEFAERPFNNDYFYPFVISLFTALLFILMLSLFSMDYNASLKFLAPVNIVFPILITYVIYVLIDFVKHRSTKYYLKATKHYILIIIFSLSISTIVYTTQGFGYAWKIPDVNKVESVSIYAEQHFDQYSTVDVKLTNDEDIEQVIDLHKQLVEQFKKANTFFNNEVEMGNYTAFLNIEYNLGGKSNFKRNFSIPKEFLPTYYEFTTLKGVIENNQPLLQGKSVDNLHIYDTINQSEVIISNDTLDKIINTYLNDLLLIEDNDTNNVLVTHLIKYDYSKSEKTTDGHIYEENDFQLEVDERFSNTIKLLNSLHKEELQSDTYLLSAEIYGSTNLNSHYYTPWIYSPKESNDKPLSDLEAIPYLNRVYLSSSNYIITDFIVVLDTNYDEILYILPVFN